MAKEEDDFFKEEEEVWINQSLATISLETNFTHDYDSLESILT